MGNESKIRVVVNYEGIDRALFSIRENRNNHDLTVVLHCARNYEDVGARNDVQVRRHKLSVHGSPDSQGTTITREFVLADERRLTSAQFIKNSKISLFCIVYSMLMPELSADHYRSKPRARDPVVRIGKFSRSDFATLIYHIVVARHGDLLPFVLGHACKPIEFKKWKIGVYSTFMDLPATPYGRFCAAATRAPKTDGVPDQGYPEEFLSSDGAESLPSDKLLEALMELDNQLSARTVLKLCTLPTTSDPDKTALMQHQFNFHPTTASLAAERIGVPRGQPAIFEHFPMLGVVVRKQ
jgi:hypothetical protein